MIASIVAASLDGTIGIGNDLPWRLPDDLKRFKEISSQGAVVMGRRTFDSLLPFFPNGREPLPGREKYVITSQLLPTTPNTHAIFLTDDGMFLEKLCAKHENVFIIGGAQIYKIFGPYCDTFYYTRVNTDLSFRENRVLCPLNFDGMELVASEFHDVDDKHVYPFFFETWKLK